MGPLNPLGLAWASDRDLAALLAQPEHAAAAAALLRECLGDNPEQVGDAALDMVAAAHDLTRAFADGSTGALPVASLRAVARREVERRGRDGWRALCPAHSGVRCVGALEGHDDEVRRLLPGIGGSLASVAVGFDRLLWSVPARRRLARPGPEDGVGAGLLLRRRGAEVRVLRPSGRGPRPVIPVPPGTIRAVAGGRFALVEGDPYGATVSVREIASGAAIFSRGSYSWDTHVGDSLDVELSPGGRFLAIGAGYGSHLDVVDLDGGGERAFASAGTRPCLVALGSEPWAVLSIGDRHEVVDVASGQSRLQLEGGQGPAALDERTRRLVRGVGSAVELVDLGGGVLWRREAGGAVEEVAIDAGGGRVAALARGAWDERERSYRPTAHLWRGDGTEVGVGRGRLRSRVRARPRRDPHRRPVGDDLAVGAGVGGRPGRYDAGQHTCRALHGALLSRSEDASCRVSVNRYAGWSSRLPSPRAPSAPPWRSNSS